MNARMYCARKNKSGRHARGNASSRGGTSLPHLKCSTWRNQSRGEPGHQSSQHLAAASGQADPVVSYARARTFSPAWLHRPFGVSFRACWKSLYSCNRRPVSAAPSLHRLCAGKESTRKYTVSYARGGSTHRSGHGCRARGHALQVCEQHAAEVESEEPLFPVFFIFIFFSFFSFSCGPRLSQVDRHRALMGQQSAVRVTTNQSGWYKNGNMPSWLVQTHTFLSRK